MRALLSVSDKTGLVPFATTLVDLGYELVSTGGTMKALADAKLPVTAVSDVTGSPEMLDGRVKTLHPKIHGGLLARRDLPAHNAQLDEFDIVPIDILVTNLYPFEATVRQEGLSEMDIVEQIDIGGPAMTRAAAKNFASVIVITDPGDYDTIAESLSRGTVGHAERRKLAAKAFGHVSTYDSLIAAWLNDADSDGRFPTELTIGMRLAAKPKYGENSHQDARAYTRLRPGKPAPGLLQATRLKGEELSFNNYLDADAAWQAAQLFDGPTVAIIKHTVPCGLAVRDTLAEAYEAAFEGDPVSAFGGIVALNRTVDLETATFMRKIKLDIIIAPGYDDDALEILMKKKATRILSLPNREGERIAELDIRPISGGILVQEPDIEPEDPSTWKVVTQKAPTEAELRDLEFAVRTLPLIKSNAIVFVKDQAIVGLGAGQPNRLESVAISARKAGEKAQGAVMASDAFFPFPDGIEEAIRAGITSVVQPGGSVKDQDVIDAADNAGISMVFTGRRHFRH
ncbi:MAG TPA: bifunctional phosphoribosylaminoimidazolecarboxamide formyltransferase/IMP cyclohydrolase [Thermomicrobiales bacterium]|nr:bifunctional phosphoribosylaminoimidazolecarboxamide formyltransferase/IMP cyclohydrolase [Thermomicrobiales bacterium]